MLCYIPFYCSKIKEKKRKIKLEKLKEREKNIRVQSIL